MKYIIRWPHTCRQSNNSRIVLCLVSIWLSCSNYIIIMDFKNTEITDQVAQTARDFAQQYIKPHVMEWDESQTFPVDVFKEMGKLGLMGIFVPEEYGGAGLGYFEYSVAIQEIAKVCGSIGLSLAAHNSLCTGHLLSFGNEEQKNKYLPKLATAEHIGAWGLTEPNTGSDAGNMKCSAVRDGDDWIINGTKSWITHGNSSDVAVVICRTGEPKTRDNSTAFVVLRGTPGFTAGKKENKLGMRASETSEMVFDNCRVPDENRLGGVGDGFKQAMKVLDGGRDLLQPWRLALQKAPLKHLYNIQKKDTSSASLLPISREYLSSWLIWQQK